MSILAVLFYLFIVASTVILWLIASYFIYGCLYTEIPTVSYEITGNKEGKPMVFIHGWPDLPCGWNKQIEYFKDRYLCINIEIPNFNINKIQNPWGYDIPNIVKGIANQIQYILQTKHKKYENEGVILMVHDWGSPLGQILMQQYPHIVSRAIIVDIGDGIPNKTWKHIMGVLTYQLMNTFCFLLPPTIIGNKLMRDYVYKINDKYLKIPIVEWEKKQNKILLHAGMNYLYFYLYKQLLTAILMGKMKEMKLAIPTIPILYIYGKWELEPWHTKKWKQTLTERKDCGFKRYHDAKHWVMHDQCDRFNKDVTNWLNN